MPIGDTFERKYGLPRSARRCKARGSLTKEAGVRPMKELKLLTDKKIDSIMKICETSWKSPDSNEWLHLQSEICKAQAELTAREILSLVKEAVNDHSILRPYCKNSASR